MCFSFLARAFRRPELCARYWRHKTRNSINSLVRLIFAFCVLLGLGTPSAVAFGGSALPTIIAIGDMHGDYEVYEGLMLASGLMDTDGNWAGGDTIFVQTGDIPDRGPSTRKIIENLQRLEAQALESGGRVIPMVGNHEAMNFVRDLRYVHPGEFAAFADAQSEETRDAYYLLHREEIEAEARQGTRDISSEDIRAQWDEETPLGKVEHEAAWSAEGKFGAWVSNNLLVAKVGPYLFAHGGFSQEFSVISLDDMNKAGQAALLAQDWSLDSIIRHRLGPLWYRGNVRGREDVPGFSRKKELRRVLDAYSATHVIIGHTRSEKGIRVTLDGRLLQIDTGASAYYGGVPSFLRIENGEFFAHEPGTVKRLQVAVP